MKGMVASAFGGVVLVCILALRCVAVEVSTVAGLQAAVHNANGGGDGNILVLPGTYALNGVFLRLTADTITIAGKSGKRSDVVLDGGYVTTEIIQIVASDITIKDLTLKRAYHHPIHVYPEDADVVGTLISNVHIIDPGQQAIKINQNGARTYSVNYGRVEGSRLELTDSGRAKVLEINGSCYTGGVDAHHAAGWSVVGNEIVGFWCSTGLSEHGVHFWSDSSGTLVERNRIRNCDRGIGFGLGSSGHSGGIIRNNMISHDSGHAYSDVGISLENAAAALVYNNTIFYEHTYPNAIEYRFAGTSGGIIKNNLTNRAIVSRQSGSTTLSHNITSAQPSWFADSAGGDLHLSRAVAAVVDSGRPIIGLQGDYDKEKRPMGRGFDIGADEWPETSAASFRALPWMMMLLQ